MPDTPSLAFCVRPLHPDDRATRLPLWAGCNAVYGRSGDTALPGAVTQTTSQRVLDPAERLWAWVAQDAARLGHPVGLVHALQARSTTLAKAACCLQNLYTLPSWRGHGVGKALSRTVHQQVQALGIGRLHRHTRTDSRTARRLYDRIGTLAGVVCTLP